MSGFSQNQNDKEYSLYIFMLEDCPITIQYTDELNTIYDEFHDKIDFIGLFPNFYSKSDAIDNFKKKYNILFNLKTDHYKKLTNSLGGSITPEVFLVKNEDQSILYQGSIDNQYYKPGRKRNSGIIPHLYNAITETLKNQDITISKTKAIGCFINFNDNSLKK
jgi:hypothetical protein